ncbi:MAG: NAD(P)H-dependent oxidoreductase subunit E [Spirochaetaceae bacterium]|jgi:NADH-quinone oxidoreductase subunit E|nr:NAD(P)H-dependent oxidoreductase subunit E [Spirochaetaceae bacterium]
MANTGGITFSKDLEDFIALWKTKPGNIIMILHKVQEEQGYISAEAAEEVAARTGTPLAKVYGIMTFYHLFKTKKPGKNQISVCLGTACYLKGGRDIYDEARSILGIRGDETVSPDGEFSVEPVRCIGCCGLSPVVTINGDVHGRLTKGDVKPLIEQYRNKVA